MLDILSMTGWNLPIEDGSYCLYCVLFAKKSSPRDVQLVHIPYCKRPDAQGCFKRHTKTNGIDRKSMENYESFLRELSGKQETVDMQVTKPTQKKCERNKNVLLSIVDIIKTIGSLDIALRGH